MREVIGTEDDSEVRRYKAKMEERARREEVLLLLTSKERRS